MATPGAVGIYSIFVTVVCFSASYALYLCLYETNSIPVVFSFFPSCVECPGAGGGTRVEKYCL